MIDVATKIVSRDAKSKTHAWFSEHIPSIIERDGKSAFERTRNRAILAKNDQKLETSKNQPPPILSYIPLDRLRKYVSKPENLEVLEAAVKEVLEHSDSYTGELEILDQLFISAFLRLSDRLRKTTVICLFINSDSIDLY